MLTLENKADLLIEVKALCKILEQAVKAARKLNVRYFWTDSLGIIQNDPTDWVKEASLMCDPLSQRMVQYLRDGVP